MWLGVLSPTSGVPPNLLSLVPQPCLEDFVTPIRVNVTITLPYRDPPGHILSPGSALTWVEVTPQ